MSRINADWHSKNKMPKKPNKEQRLKWHAEHYNNCQCRVPSQEMLQELKKLKMI